jgi:hypothetical protein
MWAGQTNCFTVINEELYDALDADIGYNLMDGKPFDELVSHPFDLIALERAADTYSRPECKQEYNC